MYQYLLLTVVAFLYAIDVCCQEHKGVITSGPVSQIVAPHEKVSFHCLAQGDLVFWKINKRCPCPGNERDDFERRGFHFLHSMTELGEHNNTITVEANLENNETLISCTVLEQSNGEVLQYNIIQEGSLIIAGPPLAPSVGLNVRHLNNSDIFTFTLTWSTPFTWSGFPIISYKIIMTNYSGEEPRQTVDFMNSSCHPIEYSGRGIDCYMLTFSVEANNSIGKGESTLVHSGQPIVLEEIGDVEISSTVLASGSLQFWISFLAPRICTRYQSATYNIIIYDNQHVIVDQFGPTKYTQENGSERMLVVKGLTSSLVTGRQYEVQVTVESLGVSLSRKKQITAVHNCTGTGAFCLPCPENQESNVITIGFSIGAVFLVVTFILMVIVLMVLCYRLKKKTEFDETDSGRNRLPRRKARVPSHKMEANPIYEGVMYETTPGESFKPLLNDPSKVFGTKPDHYDKACSGSSPHTTEEEVRYSGLQLSSEAKAFGVFESHENTQTPYYKGSGDDISSVANRQVLDDDNEDEIYATLR